MKNSDYWKLRFEQLENAQNQKGTELTERIERQYRQAKKEIESKIAVWYQLFADNNNVSMAEARKMLSGSELKEFKWDVQDYIKYGKENPINQQWVKQLENVSAKYNISRLEALKIQVQQNLEVLFAGQLDSIDSAMREIYTSGYYHTAFEIQKGVGIGWSFAALDEKTINKVIVKPWAPDGKNFSERIWGNKQKLINEVHNELSQNILLGADPQKAIDAISKKMNTSKNNAGRLVMTEEAYFSSVAQKDCFNELDVEQYEIVAMLDSHTSKICRSIDGKVFSMKDYQAGVTAPPFHVYCRSTTVPYFDDDFGSVGERAARNKDGNTYYVPADMNYQEWKKTFADDGSKEGLETVDKLQENDIIEIERAMAAKTFGKAAEYAKKELGISISSLSELPLETVNAVNNSIRKLYKDVPSLSGIIDEMIVDDIDEIFKSSIRWVNSSPQIRLKLSRAYFTQLSVNELEEVVSGLAADGVFTPKDGIYGVIQHEAVHLAEFRQTLKKYVDSPAEAERSLNDFELAKELKELALRNCSLDDTGITINNYLSSYAGENAAEFLAEGYSCSSSNPLANEIKRLLRKKWGM